MQRGLINTIKSFVVRGTYFDYPSLFYIIFLTFFGFVMVYSSSSFVSFRTYGNTTHFLTYQFMFATMGFIGMFFMSKVKYQKLKRLTYFFIAVEVVMLLVVLLAGVSVNGSSRWLKIGMFSFQPSEIAKLVMILYMAYICTDKTELLYSLKGTVQVFIPAVILIVPIAVENLSTALICAAIAGGVWFVATPRIKYIIPMIGAGAAFLVVMIAGRGYRGDRITAWLNPETSAKGYQTMQGLYAIGSGGLFGRGLGQSIQKMGSIPEAQNDMIFSVICEELGIVGAVGVILVFIFMLWRFKFIAEGAPDRYGSLIVVGIIIHVAVQVIINMSVVTNIIPNTGVTLPFISYGGTSIFFLLIEMGLLLAVSRQIEPSGMKKGVVNREA